MKVVLTEPALQDLHEILSYLAMNFPEVLGAFEARLRSVFRRIAMWPESAQQVLQRPGTRVVPLIRFPYKVFYQVTDDAVHILHIHYAGRRDPSA